MTRSYTDGRPTAYSLEKLPILQSRWNSLIGTTIASMAQVAFPGVPAEALLGFTAFSTSPHENTTEGNEKQPFHEIGLFQVEAGPRDGPAPNPDPHAADNSWGALHDSELVCTLLGGRAATLVPDAWKTAIRDQVAVGLVNLLQHARGLARVLDPRLRPTASDNEWYLRTMFTAFSRGGARTASILNPYAPDLMDVAEPTRWWALRRIVADQARRGEAPGALRGRSGPAYAIVRTDQKMRAGWLLRNHTGGDLTWWTAEYGPDDGWIEDAISRTAYGVPLEATPEAPP